MKTLVAALFVLLVAGCASAPSPYEPQNYQTLAWAKKSFDENKARCRLQALRHGKNKFIQTTEIDTVHFKACMERYGYHYRYGSEIADNADELRVLPLDPAEDKSALYR